MIPSERWISVVYTIYGDESYDGNKERVFAVGAVFGESSDWEKLKSKWLCRTCGVTIHAAELESDRGYFESRGHQDNQDLYRDLVTIIAESKIRGCAVSMDLRDLSTVFPGALKEQPYFFCFNEAVGRCFELLAGIPDDVEIVFDRHPENQGSASMVYDSLVNSADWRETFIQPGKLSFASRDRYVGLQVADIVAREMMKAMSNRILGMPRPTRQSIKALDATERFDLTHYDKDFFPGLREYLIKNQDYQAKWAGYGPWLQRNKMRDSAGARFMYAADLRKQEGLS